MSGKHTVIILFTMAIGLVLLIPFTTMSLKFLNWMWGFE